MNFFKSTGRGNMGEVIILGVAQIVLWGGSYFLLSVLAKPIIEETGWSYELVYLALSVALFISGLVLPKVGRLISSGNGLPVIVYAGFIMAVGLFIIAASFRYWIFLSGWIVIGFAMGMGLYDALFATLGKYRGDHTARSIVQITLISSLAPTLSWSLLSFLNEHLGWRETCRLYALFLAVSIYPVHRYIFGHNNNADLSGVREPMLDRLAVSIGVKVFNAKLYRLVLINAVLGAVITTGITINMIHILHEQGHTMTGILWLTAFLGPSQAGVRVLSLIFNTQSQLKSAIIAAVALLLGPALLVVPQIVLPGIIIFGMGNGMRSVLRGTLPLEVFGKENYSLIVSRLARLPLIGQALTPVISGLLIAYFGTWIFLIFMCGLAVLNIWVCRALNKTCIEDGAIERRCPAEESFNLQQ